MEGVDFPPKTLSTVPSRTVENKNSNNAKAFKTVFHPSTQKRKNKENNEGFDNDLPYLRSYPLSKCWKMGFWVERWNGLRPVGVPAFHRVFGTVEN